MRGAISDAASAADNYSHLEGLAHAGASEEMFKTCCTRLLRGHDLRPKLARSSSRSSSSSAI